MNKIKYNDFKNICRTCLLKCDLKFTQNNVILDVYYKLSGTSFETNDELPQQICLKCYEKINEIRTFSLQCKQSQTSLIECLNEFKNEPIQKEQETIENTNVQEIEEITIEEHKIQFEELYLPNDSVIDGLQIKSEKTDEFEVIIPELNINSLQDVSFNENVKNEETSDDNANQNDLNDTNSDKSDSTNINEVSNKVNKHLFKCDICNKSFKSLKVHSDERPLTCYTCTKTFKSSTELTRHKRIHTNERPFSCDICNKKFNHSSALSAHKRVHSNERLFECDVCTKSFKFARDLNVHKNLHNGFQTTTDRTKYGMKKKKQTREERLEKKRAAERLRYQRLTSDPVKYEQLKEKERRNYLNKKEKGKLKSIAEMTPSEQSAKRKVWAEKTRERRARLALLTSSVAPATPSCSNKNKPSPPPKDNWTKDIKKERIG